MWKLLKTRGVDLAGAVIALTVLVNEPAWASNQTTLPGPAAGILAAGAVIGAIFVARWWRRK